MKRVLIVEDDASLVLGLTNALETDGYEVSVGITGEEGLRLALAERPDLVLLDVMLPGMSGFEVLKRVRDARLNSKVIMLTSRAEEDDRVLGLELGADDYVTKPFSLRELLARLRAQLREGPPVAPVPDTRPSTFRFGDVVVDFKRREVHRGGRAQTLTFREFSLLEYLIRHPGEVLSRKDLLDEAWDHNVGETTRTVDNHILRLRKHIEPDPDNPRHIKTVRRVGYLFDPDPARDDTKVETPR
jgi:DNA-binding response OmpR family regulator